MKKLILAVMVAGFAVAVQAGNGSCSETGSCCSKTKTSLETKGECPMAKQAKAKSGDRKATHVVSNKLQSPKALSAAS